MKGSEFINALGNHISFTIPFAVGNNYITTINSDAFINQTQLDYLFIPNEIQSLNNTSFHNNTMISWEDNYSFKGNTFHNYLGEQTSFTIPNVIAGKTITSISSNSNLESLTLAELSIPNTITSIVDNIFPSTTKVFWEDNYSFKGTDFHEKLGNQSVFSIPNIISSRTMTSIEPETFKNDLFLTEVTIPSSIDKIGDYAFQGCTNLRWYVIPGSRNSFQHRIVNDFGNLVWTNHNYNNNGICGACDFTHEDHDYEINEILTSHFLKCNICTKSINCNEVPMFFLISETNHEYYCYSCDETINMPHSYIGNSGICKMCEEPHQNHNFGFLEGTPSNHYAHCNTCYYKKLV